MPAILNVGPKDHLTISAALKAASQGDMIMIHEGRYAERLHLTFPVQLVGKRKNAVVICAPPSKRDLQAEEAAQLAELCSFEAVRHALS
jgi:pectin methylesterase-like acyl-CoA thioesterase